MRQLRWGAGVLLAFTMVLSGALVQRAEAQTFPETIALPDGWLPEGIATGRGPVIYSGSRADGAVYTADLRTGAGQVLVPGAPGRVAVGLDFDRRSGALFVAGGPTGLGTVYEAATGATLATYAFTTASATFVNDVIVTGDAAWFTDSFQPVLYRVPLGPGGALPSPEAVQTIPLGGDYTHVAGFNLNGIVATPDGSALIAVHSTLGVLYRIDPATGVASTIDLGGASVSAGDGLLLQGTTLYVVRNALNEVVVIELDRAATAGTVTEVVTSASFDVPTTIARFGDRLYVVNARFSTPPTPTTPYDIVQVPRR